MELTFATLMARGARRARRDLRACGARGAHLGRRPDLSLPAAAGGALPRRHAAHRARRRLLAQHPEGEGPSDHRPAHCATSTAPRPTDDATVVRDASRRSARATCRCSSPACRSSRAPITRRSNFDEIDARCAARLRPLQGRALRGRPLHRIRARQGLVGRRPAGRARAAQFRRRALRILPRPRRRLRRLHGKNYLFREEFTSRIWATRYDFPALTRRPRQARDAARRDAVRRAGLVHQHAARRSSRIRGVREALIYAFDFEWTNKNHHVRLLRAHATRCSRIRDMMAEGKPGAGGARAARAVPRQGAGRGVRRAVRAAGVRRLGAGPRAAAQGRRSCCRRRATPIKDGKRVDAKGEPLTIEFLIDEPTLPAASHAVHQEPRDARHRRDLPHRRSGAVSQAASTTSISTSRCSASASRPTPGDALRTYFSSQAADTKGSHNLAGIADPAIDALIEKIIAADDAARAVTACRALDRVLRAGRYWVPHWYQGRAPDRLLGHVRPAGREAALRPRRSGDLVVRSREQGGADAMRAIRYDCRRMTRVDNGRLYPPPPAAHDPDPARDHAGRRSWSCSSRRAGRSSASSRRLPGTDIGATARISGSQGGDFGGARAGAGRRRRRRRHLEISRRAGPRSGIHQEPGEAVRLRQAGATSASS